MDWDCMVNPELIHIDSDCTNFFQQEIEFGWFKAQAAVWDTGQIFFTLIHPFFLPSLCFPRIWTLIRSGSFLHCGAQRWWLCWWCFQEALLARIIMHKNLHINAHFWVAKLISGFFKNDWIGWFLSLHSSHAQAVSGNRLLSVRQRMVKVCSGDILQPAQVKGVALSWGKKSSAFRS